MAIAGLEKFKWTYRGTPFYVAGAPGYRKNFSRDALIAGILARDPDLLQSQLAFSASRQGTKQSRHTGEVPGIIHHEFPAATLNGLSTRYNASDATALYLIGHEVYQKLTKNFRFAASQQDHITCAAEYILKHLRDYLFTEDPRYSGAQKFALKVTYWKDSALVGRKSGTPHYPVVYPLVHAINLRGLRSAARLLKRGDLKETAQKMAARLVELFDEKLGVFSIAKDAGGLVHGVSSDSLHMLFYLSPHDLPPRIPTRIESASKMLETPIGYRTLDPALASKMTDTYHANTVWPFEQAVIMNGARKFGLLHAEEVAKRIFSHMQESDRECFYIEADGTIRTGGNVSQLWTRAAKIYFESGNFAPLL